MNFAKENWSAYLGDKSASHYSLLDQINKENVQNLQMVWEFDGGEASVKDRSMIQCNPLIIDGVLYGTTATLKVFALDAATGIRKWTFSPDENFIVPRGLNRGLAYWQDGSDKRIFYASGEHLFSLDPADGKLITSFGKEGMVDLTKGLGRDVDGFRYHMNTPGVIHEDLYIVGGKVSETINPVPGHIRAYDVRTGEIRWIFHTIPHPGEFGYETWPEDAYLKSGGANVWAGFSLDEDREIVYAPTGSPSFDFYGGDRIGDNLFGNSIVALDANTGKRVWHFQTVHHDLWDFDLSAPPVLATILREGQEIDVVAQTTKMGLLFVLNRETGEPIYPIEEIPVPASQIEGEQTSPTQPFPTMYPTFSRTTLEEKDLAIRTEQAHKAAKQIWNEREHSSMYHPPSIKGTINFPGYYGGGEWGGAAIDPTTGVLYINANNFPWESKLSPYVPGSPGSNLYKMYCQTCHGSSLEGSSIFGNVPALVHVKDSVSREEMRSIITVGKGVMPSFSRLSEKETNQILDFLTQDETDLTTGESAWPYPYTYDGHKRFDLEDGLPMIKPPWGQLTAIDLNTAEIKWQIPLGNYDSLNIPDHPITGTQNYGGPIVTLGGVLFIAATADNKIRAFDKDTGQKLWEANLPTSGVATPSTYAVHGKQYIVIACGGGREGAKSGDSYVAFSLP
ncbi:MAG: PQQ-binding-like beta-propeller repeat protein [Saprospiraceae bacterium]|nr:PQQ-binding-like beta-propeller repeat protein [Saprospiraceae bacterium]